jgi:16S rRNA (cytidine1402-2'-O)-methyltransferase
LQEIRMLTLDEHTRADELEALLQPLLDGEDVGLLSEAGCPAVADPGANLVRLAHRRGVRVVPLVGPSSLLLALMASGLNGQSFAFLGYLPAEKAERVKRIGEIEAASQRLDQAQIFIETPYRNNQLLQDLVQTCHGETELCVASDLTLATESVATKRVADWKKSLTDCNKKPTVFVLYRRPTSSGNPKTNRRVK